MTKELYNETFSWLNSRVRSKLKRIADYRVEGQEGQAERQVCTSPLPLHSVYEEALAHSIFSVVCSLMMKCHLSSVR